MTILNHTLGFPRVGLRRELKKAQESYWAGNSSREDLLTVGRELRARHWEQQKQAGVDLLPVGDFAWYDHVLTTSLLLGNVPARHQNKDGSVDIDTLFRIGRGRAPTGEPAAAAEMTKWFNTNYHYMVPEFTKGQQFKLTWTQLLDEVDEALALGHKVKPVLLGPVTYLWLGKVKGEQFDRLSLLNDILPVYQQVLAELAKRGVEWVQIDEPALREGLPLKRSDWQRYLDNAVFAFGIAGNAVRDHTQIHTHMCYSEFGDILPEIAKMDADVISIETSRSRMELLDDFGTFAYPNQIGPGVYDIHSPRIPSTDEMVELLHKATQVIPVQQLWVNPDCGLKTRSWSETLPALSNLMAATQTLRAQHASAATRSAQ